MEKLENLISQMTEITKQIIKLAYDEGYKNGMTNAQYVRSKRQTEIKVGDVVRTLKDKDSKGKNVFPIGTIGKVTHIDDDDDELPYLVRANNNYWWYSRDMLEFVEREDE